METEDLFKKVLIDPIKLGANQLFAVAGFATAAMSYHHLKELGQLQLRTKIEIKLIVGMVGDLGISRANHEAFNLLMGDSRNNFECSYYTKRPAVHSKIYIWAKDDEPMVSWCGSANYTQTAFLNHQLESIATCDPKVAVAFYQKLIPGTVFCDHLDANMYVQEIPEPARIQPQTQEAATSPEREVAGFERVSISLLDKSGNLPDRSGLNWGQRPEERREPNQAYIHVPAKVYKTDFFPPIGIHFTVLTDDDKILICSRAQANGKAIQTPHNNSLLGEYFRNRLGLANGALVTLEDLQRYGTTSVEFLKIDNETYYMDFSKPNGG